MKIGVAVIILLAASIILLPVLGARESSDIWDKVYEAYDAIRVAEDSGGNVTCLVNMLNSALELIDRAEEAGSSGERNSVLRKASSILGSIVEYSSEIRLRGEEEAARRQATYLIILVSLVILIILAYFYGEPFAWRTWLRMRGDYKIRASAGGRRSMILDEEVMAVVAAIIVVVTVFAVSQLFLTGIVEPFSELAVLGEDMKIGDYPSNVVRGEEFTIYVYIGNYVGKTMLYDVEVKLGNKTTPVDPSPATPVKRIHLALAHNSSRKIPLTLSLNDTGEWRIIFELWEYNDTAKTFTYGGKWCQIWVNVEPPPQI